MVAALTAALKDSDKDVRETAMHALVQLRDPAIFEPLVQALKDASPDVREQAAHGLSQMRDKRAVDPLMAALKDRTPACARASSTRSASCAIPASTLIGALKDESPTCASRRVRPRAAARRAGG